MSDVAGPEPPAGTLSPVDSTTPSSVAPPDRPPMRGLPVERPPFRRLNAYAFDPSLSTRIENVGFNRVTIKVPWEYDPATGCDVLEPGPVGEYLEVVDVDPASGCFYAPVNLNEPYLLATDGLAPSEGNPQFHQQMAYAVAMTTIKNFERSLGRHVLWAPLHWQDPADRNNWHDDYVPRLRIYPHALREANAYYSPEKKALLFGYFPAPTSDLRLHLPGGLVFCSLSHDVIAHETTHALLDGLHPRFIEPSNRDVLAFHEAFADIVALFQHFSFPEVLRSQIARTRGDLGTDNLLAQLAQEFGNATGLHGALRDALTKKPDPTGLQNIDEPHDRGSWLVAAVFAAFIMIYKDRTADLMRLATGGTGVLPEGQIHPDLVNRLAAEAAKASQHVLNMCVRALDYCPPVDLTFGDYLRALITADFDLVRDDDLGYRVTMVDAFRQYGIYPLDVRSLSVDSLRWRPPQDARLRVPALPAISKLRQLVEHQGYTTQREAIYCQQQVARAELHKQLAAITDQWADELGLDKTMRTPDRKPYFEVHSLRPARRVGPDGQLLSDVVIEITQARPYYDPAQPAPAAGQPETRQPLFVFRGGTTLIVDLESGMVRYSIAKSIKSQARFDRQRDWVTAQTATSLRALYFGSMMQQQAHEPFAFLHRMGH